MTGGLNGTEGETATADQVTEQEIRSQLERILLSPWFRNSKRHPRFLRFVIDKALSGTAQDIKERIVGVEVFDREIHYDVSSDPIVRVAAGEIRKRLAQYYIQPGHEQELRIELSPGSYVPTFHRPHEADPAVIDGTHVSPPLIIDSVPSLKPAHPGLDSVTSVANTGRRNRIFAVLAFASVVLVLIIAAASVWLPGHRRSSDLDMFWRPLLSASPGTILCIGDLDYLIKNQSPTLPEDINRIFAARDHVAAKDTLALARLAGFMGKSNRYGSVLLADNATLTDLRGQPAIMIGAFDNHWTEELLSGYRFQFTRDTATQVGTIRDTRNPTRASWGIDLKSPPAQVHKDYALVSRIKSPITEQTELIIAGIGPSGTVAASEFITNPRYFNEFVKRAPPGWQNREIQIVITTEVIGERSAPPHVLTFDVR
jgi:hypothetical protein